MQARRGLLVAARGRRGASFRSRYHVSHLIRRSVVPSILDGSAADDSLSGRSPVQFNMCISINERLLWRALSAWRLGTRRQFPRRALPKNRRFLTCTHVRMCSQQGEGGHNHGCSLHSHSPMCRRYCRFCWIARTSSRALD